MEFEFAPNDAEVAGILQAIAAKFFKGHGRTGRAVADLDDDLKGCSGCGGRPAVPEA